MAGILEGVLERNILLGKFAVEVGSVGMCGRDWRRGGRGRCLLRWRSVV